MPVILSDGRPVSLPRQASRATLAMAPHGRSVDLLRSDKHVSVPYEWVYRSQPFVFATINKLAAAAARNPLYVYQEDIETQTFDRVRNHDLARLFAKPCPRMSQYRWLGSLIRSLKVHGHALVWKERARGSGSQVVNLWFVPWPMVTEYADDLSTYRYALTVNGNTWDVGPEEVIHVRHIGGRSPLEALRGSIAVEDAAVQYQAHAMHNGVTPRAVFGAKGANQRGVDMLREELSKLYAGPENAGNFIVTSGEVSVDKIAVSPGDLGLTGIREFSRQEVLAALDVPPPLVGLMENATLANVKEFRAAMFDAVRGDLEMLQQEIQVQLIDDEPSWDGLVCGFDTDSWALPDPEARAKMHMLNQQASVSTINERRKIEKLPPLDDPIADMVFMPANMVPVGTQGDGTLAGTPMQGIADRIVSDTLAD